jgi:hypothetical protein
LIATPLIGDPIDRWKVIINDSDPIDPTPLILRERDDAIVSAYRSGGYSLKAIGDHFGLHYSRVSRIVAAVEKAKGKT